MLIAPLVLANIVYLLTFDYIPSSLRLLMAAGIGVGYMAVGLLGVLSRPSAGTTMMLAGACLLFLAWGLGDILDPFETMRRQAVPEAGVRYAVAVMSGIAILSFPEQVPGRAVVVLAGVTFAFALLIALTHPFVALGDMSATRFASFTGSPMADGAAKAGASGEGLHSSGYVIALLALTCFAAGHARVIPAVAAGALFVAASVLLLGYKVRTAQVLVLCFFATFLLQQLAHASRQGTLLSLGTVASAFAGMTLLVLYVFTTWSTGDIDVFSSGRTSTYVERFSIIEKRAFASVLFGAGPGSDYTYSGVWWWAPKNSHNDFLMTLMESGVVGLLGLLLYLAGIIARAGRWGWPFVVAFCASSAISNGLIGRSTIMPLMFVAMALLVARRPSLLPARAASVPVTRRAAAVYSAVRP